MKCLGYYKSLTKSSVPTSHLAKFSYSDIAIRLLDDFEINLLVLLKVKVFLMASV